MEDSVEDLWIVHFERDILILSVLSCCCLFKQLEGYDNLSTE